MEERRARKRDREPETGNVMIRVSIMGIVLPSGTRARAQVTFRAIYNSTSERPHEIKTVRSCVSRDVSRLKRNSFDMVILTPKKCMPAVVQSAPNRVPISSGINCGKNEAHPAGRFSTTAPIKHRDEITPAFGDSGMGFMRELGDCAAAFVLKTSTRTHRSLMYKPTSIRNTESIQSETPTQLATIILTNNTHPRTDPERHSPATPRRGARHFKLIAHRARDVNDYSNLSRKISRVPYFFPRVSPPSPAPSSRNVHLPGAPSLKIPIEARKSDE
ncbi:hypothetical protein EVAR_36312_1 [Eumeta japonica]|uniref:Uncharacterized protein n=1 Tax=Eumeta variegata TaxID=151549 RepID=A0A4C1VIF3_EUMVA|nr:hypothetical protein EVAR_36312_1 [Eumeta japonica]